MPSFVWRGKTRAGAVQEGIQIADTRDAAMAALRRQNITVTNIREKGREIPFLPRLPIKIQHKFAARLAFAHGPFSPLGRRTG